MELIEYLSRSQFDSLITKHYKKNEIIFCESDRCNYISILVKGEIEIVSNSLGGNEIVYNKFEGNGIFGNNLIFSDLPFYKGNVVAKKDSIVYLISKENLLDIMKNNPIFLEKYLSIISNDYLSNSIKIKLLSFDNAIDRFYYYLQINNNVIKFDNITKLAKILFLKRETTSRLVHKLLENNKIYIKDNCLYKR